MKIWRTRSVWPPAFGRGDAPRGLLFSGLWAGRLAWALRPRFLRNADRKQDHLFAGPWVGEFGWELMNWQGYIRALRPFFETITVCANASSAALYTDCCDTFIPHSIKGQSNAHVVFDIQNPEELRRILSLIPPEARHLRPLRYIPAAHQTFIRYGDPHAFKESADILIHARGNPRVSSRNWPVEKWRDLVAAFKERDLKVGAIGLSGSTLDVPGVKDYRDISLRETMDRLAGARCALGPSSGPMHLASLCGTPHLVWTDQRTYGMRKTSREKYERWWNPLGTNVRVMDAFGFDPPVEDVLSRMLDFIQRL